MLDRLTSADFSAHLNQTFRIHLGAHGGAAVAETQAPLETELIDVAELGEAPPAGDRRRAFSIVLRGPPDVVLPQRIYAVEHPDLGTLELFLVPLGPDRVGMRYEAVFT